MGAQAAVAAARTRAARPGLMKDGRLDMEFPKEMNSGSDFDIRANAPEKVKVAQLSPRRGPNFRGAWKRV